MSGSEISVNKRASIDVTPHAPVLRASQPDSNVSELARGDSVAYRDHLDAPNAASSIAVASASGLAPDASSLRRPVQAGPALLPASTPRHSDFGAALAEAKSRGLAQLTLEVSKTTHFSRTIVSRMTLAGLGLSIGLLFAGQPFAVVLIVPAFAAIGVGLRYLTRRRANDGTKPHIEAFKLLMASADERVKATPQYAHALKLYQFLGHENADVGHGCAHLADAYNQHAPWTQAVDTKPAGSAAESLDSVASPNAIKVDHTTQSAAPPSTSQVNSDSSFAPWFGDQDEARLAWRDKHPGVDSANVFDERDMQSYDEIINQIRTLDAHERVPTWALPQHVFTALGLQLSDYNARFTASELRERLELSAQ